MTQELKIKLDDQLFKKLKELCMGDEIAIEEYVKKLLIEKFNQEEKPDSPKENLGNYLNKGPTGSRNYGVKGQGW